MSRYATKFAAVFFLLAGVADATSAFAQSSYGDRYKYLQDATEEIVRIDHNVAVLSTDDVARIAKIACDALRRLVNDPNYSSDLQRLQSFNSQHATKAAELLKDFPKFIREFGRVEREILQQTGISTRQIDELMAAAVDIRHRVVVGGFSATDVLSSTTSLADAVCALRDQLQQGIQDANARRKIQLVIYGIGGVTLVLVDATAATSTVGAAAPILVASGSIGATITAVALKEWPVK